MDIICKEDVCHVSASLIQKTMDGLTKDKEPVIPKFIITYGPPGSGKTSMLKDAVYNNQVQKENTVEVNVDDIISQFDQYKEDLSEVRKLIQLKKDAEAKEAAITAYWKYRQTGATFSDFILNTALLNRYNVIWETTGSSIQWSTQEIERIRSYGYKIIIVYPFVDLDQLKERTERRGWAELRFLDADYIQQVSLAAQKNFMDLAKHADETYFYNNSVPDHPDWNPVVYFTNYLINPTIQCNLPELQKLLPKMTDVLGEALLQKCT